MSEDDKDHEEWGEQRLDYSFNRVVRVGLIEQNMFES